jgi:glycosyltransferase involved in cell wall biosynthesis
MSKSSLNPEAVCAPPDKRGGFDHDPLTAKDTIHIGLLTGGGDKDYALCLASALVANSVRVDFIGSDEVDGPALHGTPWVNFLNLRGDQRRDASRVQKMVRVLRYYARLLRYAATARPRLFHILWNNKFQFFDRTLLMLYYKLLGRRIALTAHNVNAGRRDLNDSALNRFTLGIQYRLADHIFVHTEKMKAELVQEFKAPPGKVAVIPYGLYNNLPNTGLTSAQARQKLGLASHHKVLLFFGNIAPYKGLDILVRAFGPLVSRDDNYRLIIAGPIKNSEEHWAEIQNAIARGRTGRHIIQKLGYVPDPEVEIYFKAADVLILPYTHIFQSGVLFLGFSFGLPAVVTDVGSLKEDVIENKTGFLCLPSNASDLADAIARYFSSELFASLNTNRPGIKAFAEEGHSWKRVGHLTRDVYSTLLNI